MRLIDADALINDMLTDYGCDPKYIADETIDGLKPYTDQLILERIGLQPTIDAVPVVHGKWIHLYKNNYRCSVCGAWFIFEDENNPYEDGRFCSYCGARMDGGKDDNTQNTR